MVNAPGAPRLVPATVYPSPPITARKMRPVLTPEYATVPEMESMFGSTVTGAVSLRATSAALVARTDLFLSIDTGPMHLAAALGVPTVGLFGPTNPRHHGPWGEPGRSVVLRTGIACSPCAKPERRACPVNACLTELSPRRVFEAGRDLLAAAAAPS